MSVKYRPGIVTGDLALALDAYNPRSYPGSGSTWYDLSGNRLHMACNASYLSSTGLTSGASASTATTDILNTDSHTICFAIKFMGTGTYPNGYTNGWEKIFSFNAGGSDRTPSMWRYPSEVSVHWRYDPGNTGSDFNNSVPFNSAGQFPLNTWFYICCTKNGVNTTVYKNGSLHDTGTVASPKTQGTAAVTLFEYYTASMAQIGCLQIYRRPLSATEIAQNFTAIRGNYGI